MRKHDAHVREFRRMLLNRYPFPKYGFLVFIFFNFVMGFYLGYSYAFYADNLFNCLK